MRSMRFFPPSIFTTLIIGMMMTTRLISATESAPARAQEALETGDAQAQYDLAMKYHEGQGVKQSYKKAKQWLEKAAEQGHADAQFNLGALHKDGLLAGKPELNQAPKCKSEIKKERGKDYQTARTWFLKAAKQGHAKSQFEIGNFYAYGPSGHINSPVWWNKAKVWWERAAEQGLAEAQARLDLMG